MQLKQFIPQEFCLKCDVCCRFPQLDAVWSPLFTDSEIKDLVDRGILPPILFTSHQKPQKPGAQRINLIEHKDGFICPCFNLSNQKCKIYINRPLECWLYPFLLVRDNEKFYLARDNQCPYFKSGPAQQIQDYVDYLKQEFQKESSLSFLQQNQGLFSEYPLAELELLRDFNF